MAKDQGWTAKEAKPIFGSLESLKERNRENAQREIPKPKDEGKGKGDVLWGDAE